MLVRWLFLGTLLWLIFAVALAWAYVQLPFTDPHRLDRLLFGCALLSINLVVVPGLYWWDKRVAMQGAGGRVPELALHSFAFVGGAMGALCSQRWFRHKTRKRFFGVVTWTAFVGNLVLLWLCFAGLGLV